MPETWWSASADGRTARRVVMVPRATDVAIAQVDWSPKDVKTRLERAAVNDA